MANNTNTRGFKSLIGKTIRKINASAINCVVITCTDGTIYNIDTDDTHMGIPIIALDKIIDPKKGVVNHINFDPKIHRL